MSAIILDTLSGANVFPALPLGVAASKWSDEPAMNLRGPGWTFGTSAWRVLDRDGLLFGRASREAARVAESVGRRIVGVGLQSARLRLDSAFVSDNGWRLEVFSAQLFGPWTHLIPGLTLVAPVS